MYIKGENEDAGYIFLGIVQTPFPEMFQLNFNKSGNIYLSTVRLTKADVTESYVLVDDSIICTCWFILAELTYAQGTLEILKISIQLVNCVVISISSLMRIQFLNYCL